MLLAILVMEMGSWYLMEPDFESYGFEAPKIPVVHIETDTFSADMYELYEMPSGLVLSILESQGPEQMSIMSEAFRLAIVNPSDAEKMEVLSFNELASAMFQWYKKSSVRVEPVKRVDVGTGVRTLKEILETLALVEEMMEEDSVAEPPAEEKPKFSKPLNDPGDGVSPFEL